MASGGAREGSGRKAMGVNPVVFKLSEDDLSVIDGYPGKNRTDKLRNLTRKAAGINKYRIVELKDTDELHFKIDELNGFWQFVKYNSDLRKIYEIYIDKKEDIISFFNEKCSSLFEVELIESK
jgi:hypothetical protein